MRACVRAYELFVVPSHLISTFPLSWGRFPDTHAIASPWYDDNVLHLYPILHYPLAYLVGNPAT